METVDQHDADAWAQAILADKFALWVRQLSLGVIRRHPLEMRLANRPEINRIGGLICGQALMAAADTAMVLAITDALGGFVEMATLAMNTQFMAPVTGEDGRLEIAVNKLGKSIAFGEVRIFGMDSGTLCAHATLTYSIRR